MQNITFKEQIEEYRRCELAMDIHRTDVVKVQSLLNKQNISSKEMLGLFELLPAWMDSLRSAVADDILNRSVKLLESRLQAMKDSVATLLEAEEPDMSIVDTVKGWAETAARASDLLRFVDPELEIIKVNAQQLQEKALLFSYEMEVRQGLKACTGELQEGGLNITALDTITAFISEHICEGKPSTHGTQQTLQVVFENLAVCLGIGMAKVRHVKAADDAEQHLATYIAVHGALSLLHRVLEDSGDSPLRSSVLTILEPHFPLYTALLHATAEQKGAEPVAKTFVGQTDLHAKACHLKSCTHRCEALEDEEKEGCESWEPFEEFEANVNEVLKAMTAFLADVSKVVVQQAEETMKAKNEQGKALFGKSWKAGLPEDMEWEDLCKAADESLLSGTFLKDVSVWLKQTQQDR